ncbi:AbiV family abortive infection protein [Mesorhizobium sp. 43Arga]
MIEEEIIAWLSQARAPIRRDGVMSSSEVAEAVTAYLDNGLSLFEDALLLCKNGRVSRAAALVVLGLEEVGKVPLLVNAFLRFEHGVDKEAWKAYWKSGGSHKAKQALILGYGKIIRHQVDGDPVFSRRLYRHYAPENVLEALDAFKQSNFYVDLRQDGIHAPGNDERTLAALDYLLTFGQERADSFCAWHVSARRSADQLDVALGRKSVARWTPHYAVPEVRADILYQAAALSASHVPDYGTFCDFIAQYKAKVSEKHFKEALISLAGLLKDRVDGTEALPLYYARYLNAFKLMISLSDQKQVLGASFGKKLRELLLPGSKNAA